MENKSHALAAGFFVVLMLALLVALATWLSRDMGQRSIYEISTADTVTGLQPQAAVRFRGVSVGKVESIGFDSQVKGNVLIRMSVDDAAPITSTTFATLDLQGVTGLTYVQLDDSTPAGGPMASSSAQPARIPLRAGLLASLSVHGAQTLNQLEIASERLTALLSDANQQALIGSVQNIGKAAQDLSALSKGLDSTVRDQLRPALSSVPGMASQWNQTLSRLRESAGQIDQAADATAKTAAEFGRSAQQLSGGLARINAPGGTLERLGTTMDQLGTAAQSLTQGSQQLQSATLPRVGRLVDEGARAAQTLQRSAQDLSDNPQSLLWGNSPVPPGPGENGFTAPRARSAVTTP